MNEVTMSENINVKIPAMGESISEGTISRWFKKTGESVKADEAIFEIETDKVTQEIYAPAGGILSEIKKKEGETASVGEVVAIISAGASETGKTEPPSVKSSPQPGTSATHPMKETLPPAARKLAAENNIDTSKIEGSGKHGQVTKADVLASMPSTGTPLPQSQQTSVVVSPPSGLRENVVPMSRLRRAIAERLVSAQHNAAILTTFNEVDMKPVMDLRSKYNDEFQKKYGVKMGFMSFFLKAVIRALKEIPAINAEIRGTDIVYKNFYDIGVAVGGPKGLVVPVVRNADLLSFAGVELEIARLAGKVQNGTISLPEMDGGTFTISNGGIYGSMMSTPILNPPQSGILGMHNITKRAVVVDEQIVIRPMMYIALSYDHRIVDGKEAVTFLVRIKQAIEDPTRLLLEV